MSAMSDLENLVAVLQRENAALKAEMQTLKSEVEALKTKEKQRIWQPSIEYKRIAGH